MEYFTFLYLYIFNVKLLNLESVETATFNQLHILTYIFSNLSLTPSDGTKRAKQIISGGGKGNQAKEGLFSRNLQKGVLNENS